LRMAFSLKISIQRGAFLPSSRLVPY